MRVLTRESRPAVAALLTAFVLAAMTSDTWAQPPAAVGANENVFQVVTPRSDLQITEQFSRVFESQTAGEWKRLKSCPGPHCGWLFYDSSRNASSKWCSMSICGNRTKTVAYRRRRSAS